MLKEPILTKNAPFPCIRTVQEISFPNSAAQATLESSKRWYIDPETRQYATTAEIYDTELDRVCFAKRTAPNLPDCVGVAKVMDKLSTETYAVPKVHSIIEEDGDYWIVTEKVEGKNLEDFLKEGGQLSKQEFLFTFHEISEACQSLAQDNVLHNDLAARNFILDENHHRYPRLTDFDLALKTENDQTKPINPEAHLFEYPIYHKATEKESVDDLIAGIEDVVAIMPESEVKTQMSQFIFNLRHQTVPHNFEELSQQVRQEMGTDKKGIEQMKLDCFMPDPK